MHVRGVFSVCIFVKEKEHLVLKDSDEDIIQ